MRVFKRLAVAATAAGLILGTAAGTASAATATARPDSHTSRAVWLRSGETSLTTAPGIAGVLLHNDIVPIATLPGVAGAQSGPGGVSVRFSFPVTGGALNLKRLTGTINHKGGILFIDPATGKQIAVSDFTISVGEHVLTAVVNGDPKVRVPLLALSLGGANIQAGRHFVRVSGIVARLTKTAAGALDATFGTTLFTAGLELGTASTTVLFR